VYSALAVAWHAARDVELRLHEFPHHGAETRGERIAARRMFLAATTIAVHTERERHEFAEAFGIPETRITVADPGAHFERRTSLDQVEARRRLGLPESGFVFLSIGFLQPHKGFDRSIRAFAGLAEHAAQLEIVGSLRVEDTEFQYYVEDLRALANATPGVTLHETYVSDASFDEWIVASDALVLPYRLIWSSSVCERAALYDRPVIASRTGGLADQASGSGAILVDSDRELAVAMRRLLGLYSDVREVGGWPAGDRDAVMSEIRSRAARRGSGSLVTDRDGRSQRITPGAATAPLRRLTPLTLPLPRSARPGVSAVKRLIRRLTAWQIDPIIGQVNRLQQATIDALAEPPADAAAEGGDRRGTTRRSPREHSQSS
jgi:glycosyltransferase involved in cell wall biosynthesis